MPFYLMTILLLFFVACEGSREVNLRSVGAEAGSAIEITSVVPPVAKPGDTVTLTGKGFQVGRVYTLSNGIKVTASATNKASFVMPGGMKSEFKTFEILNEGVAVSKFDLVVEDPTQKLPISLIDASEVCSTIRYLDRNGKTQQGSKNCATGTVANCTADGVVGCVTTASYKSADTTVATAANIRSGVTIAGQAGEYPSSMNPLAGADGTADLSDNTATREGQLRSATDFEFFKSDGMRVVATGDDDITVSNIKGTIGIFGITGSYVGTPPNEWDLRAGVTVGTATGKLKTNCRNGAALATFDISMPKAATVNVDDTFTFATAHGWSVGDTLRISYETVPPATPAINNTTTYYVIVSSATSIKLATSGANATGGTAIDITGAGDAVSIFRWNDGVLGTADTVEDYNNAGAALTQSPWSSANLCGGVAATAADEHVWLDVTTSGGSASSCTSSPSQCKMKDKISGLEWSKTQSTSMRWGVAMDHCHNLSIDGVTGWRLPTQKELMDAYNHGIRSAASNNWISLTHMNTANFWSSSTLSYNPANVWYVYFTNGSTFSSAKTEAYQAVCVR